MESDSTPGGNLGENSPSKRLVKNKYNNNSYRKTRDTKM